MVVVNLKGAWLPCFLVGLAMEFVVDHGRYWAKFWGAPGDGLGPGGK